jgi:hypothetical protein
MSTFADGSGCGTSECGSHGFLTYTREVCKPQVSIRKCRKTMSKRINVILPDKTVAVLDRVTTEPALVVDLRGREVAVAQQILDLADVHGGVER